MFSILLTSRYLYSVCFCVGHQQYLSNHICIDGIFNFPDGPFNSISCTTGFKPRTQEQLHVTINRKYRV